MAKVLIFSHYHDAWWRPDASGYTTDIVEAGVYDADCKTVKGRSGSDRDEVVPAASVLHLLEYQRTKAQDMIDSIRGGEAEAEKLRRKSAGEVSDGDV